MKLENLPWVIKDIDFKFTKKDKTANEAYQHLVKIYMKVWPYTMLPNKLVECMKGMRKS